MKVNRIVSTALLAAAVATGCGGGGGSDSTSNGGTSGPSGGTSGPSIGNETASLDITGIDGTNVLASGIEARLATIYSYTGSAAPQFSLLNEPTGMIIDQTSGVITWTPDAPGTSATFTVTATAGDLQDEFTQDLSVAPETAVVADTFPSLLQITDPTSDLIGLELNSTVSNFTSAQITTLDTNFELPEDIEAFGKPFKLTGVATVPGDTMAVRLPAISLPPGYVEEDIQVYAYTDTGSALDMKAPAWIPTIVAADYEGTATEPVVVANVGHSDGIYQIGFDKDDSSGPVGVSRSSRAIEQNDGFICKPKLKRTTEQEATDSTTTKDSDKVTICQRKLAVAEGGVDPDGAGPEIAVDPEYQVTVRNFHKLKTEPAISILELASWIYEARAVFDRLDMGYDANVDVIVKKLVYNTIGLAASGDDFKTLYLNSEGSRNASRVPAISKSFMKGTVVHEYFHHAQARTGLEGAPNIVLNKNFGKTTWLIEGLAKWYEDEVFDAENTYAEDMDGGQVSAVVADGIAGPHGSTGTTFPYKRFAFFKMIGADCPAFKPEPDLGSAGVGIDYFLNSYGVELDATTKEDPNDPYWAGSVIDILTDADCNFTDALGEGWESTMEAALLKYTHATSILNDLSQLDSNEGSTFNFGPTHLLHFKDPFWTTGSLSDFSDENAYTHDNTDGVPRMGVATYEFAAGNGNLPDTKEAYLKVEPSTANKSLLVSIVGAEANQFEGAETINGYTHQWFDTGNGTTEYVFDLNGQMPHVYAMVINSDRKDAVRYKLTFGIRNKAPVDPGTTAPEEG